jgi:type IX secretion system PorP/SprF family membrane protein
MASVSYAQKDAVFMQQSTNRELINPATAGKGGDVNFAFGVRQQWTGFPGPSTQTAHGSGFIRNIRSGFGLSWVGDKFGPQKTQNIKVNYAYFVPFEEKAFLSLGLGMGFIHHVYDEAGFFAMEDYDEILTGIKLSKTSPDFDFGIEFNTRYLEAGASVTHLIHSKEDQSPLRPGRNMYVYTRGKVPVNKYWDFIPGLTWFNARNLNVYEISAAFRYNNNIYIGLVYRNPMTVGFSAGINIYGRFRLSYSYDYGIDELSSYNDGSHEVFLSYNIPVNTTYVRSKLRFFRWKMF